MNVKKIVGFAVLAAASSFASVANAANTFASTVTNFDLQGGFWIDNNAIGDNTLAPKFDAATPGAFTQTLTFTTYNPGLYDLKLETYSNISGLSWTVDGGSVASGVATGVGAFYNGKNSTAEFSLTSGTHTLVVNGTFNYSAVPGDQSTTGTYFGQVVTAPVPEPETLAMLLAGLGVVGMVSRRRNKADAVLA